jgi:hypothetical protein
MTLRRGAVVRLAGTPHRAAILFPVPTAATSGIFWDPIDDRERLDTFNPRAVATVLEVAEVLASTYVRVLVGTSMGWLDASLLEVVG